MQKQIKYKNNDFTIRENALGIGAVISKLAAAYEDELLLARYHVMRLPDYEQYQSVMRDINQISLDYREQSAKLKKAKQSEKKKLQGIVNADKKALDAQFEVLQKPALNAIANRMTSISNEVLFGFINNTDNLKVLCDALLIGDTSVIEYDNPDEDLLALRDKIFEVFFSIKASIYK